MSEGPKSWMRDIKSLVISAIVVIVALQAIVAALLPMLPYLIGAAVLFAVIAIAWGRSTKL